MVVGRIRSRGYIGNMGKPRVERGKFWFEVLVARARSRGVKNSGKPRLERGRFWFVVKRVNRGPAFVDLVNLFKPRFERGKFPGVREGLDVRSKR